MSGRGATYEAQGRLERQQHRLRGAVRDEQCVLDRPWPLCRLPDRAHLQKRLPAREGEDAAPALASLAPAAGQLPGEWYRAPADLRIGDQRLVERPMRDADPVVARLAVTQRGQGKPARFGLDAYGGVLGL